MADQIRSGKQNKQEESNQHDPESVGFDHLKLQSYSARNSERFPLEISQAFWTPPMFTTGKYRPVIDSFPSQEI